jgi:hypothetical protein
MDIRITSTHRAPNSTLLISARGELAVQRNDGTGKDVVPVARWAPRRSVLSHFRRRVDPAGHAARYLNGTLDLHPATGPQTPALT